MQHRKTLVLLLLLQTENIHTQKSDSSCRLSSEFPAPEVIPWDTKSINVSWDKVFLNCLREEVKGLKVVVVTTMNAKTEHNEYDMKFDDNEGIVQRPPCIEHSIQLVLEFNDKERRALRSFKTEYNKPAILNQLPKSEDLYSGWLETKVVQNICLKKETDEPTVTIPDPPEALKECIKTKGDEVLELTTVNVGDDVGVKILVQKPWGAAGDHTVSPVVKNIQECMVCQVNTTVPPTVEAHNSSHLRVSWENAFQGCKKFEVRNVTITVDGKREIGQFQKSSALMQDSACVNHNVSVELFFKNTNKDPLKSAEITYAAKESDYCQEAASNSLVIGLGIGIGGLLVILAVAGILVFRKHKKQSKKEDEKFEDNDENPVYGLYSSDGIYTATEMTDYNETYGVGDV